MLPDAEAEALEALPRNMEEAEEAVDKEVPRPPLPLPTPLPPPPVLFSAEPPVSV